jgi:hypothetical protein
VPKYSADSFSADEQNAPMDEFLSVEKAAFELPPPELFFDFIRNKNFSLRTGVLPYPMRVRYACVGLGQREISSGKAVEASA